MLIWIDSFVVLVLKYVVPLLLVVFIVYCKILYPKYLKRRKIKLKKRYSGRILTLPNLVTGCGIVLALVSGYFFLKEKYLLSIICFVSSGISDVLDGFLAKKMNQRTYLGEKIDPLRDRILLFVGILMACSLLDLRYYWFLLPLLIGEGGIAVIGFLSWKGLFQKSGNIHLAGKARQAVHLLFLFIFFLNKFNLVFWHYFQLNEEEDYCNLMLIMGISSLIAFYYYFKNRVSNHS